MVVGITRRASVPRRSSRWGSLGRTVVQFFLDRIQFARNNAGNGLDGLGKGLDGLGKGLEMLGIGLDGLSEDLELLGIGVFQAFQSLNYGREQVGIWILTSGDGRRARHLRCN